MGTLCNTPAHLYCFGIDHTVPVALIPETTRRAFVTETNVPATAGIAGFDRNVTAKQPNRTCPQPCNNQLRVYCLEQ